MTDNNEHAGRWLTEVIANRVDEPDFVQVPAIDLGDLRGIRDHILQLERERNEALSNYGEQSDLLKSFHEENKQLKARVAELEVTLSGKTFAAHPTLELVAELREARRSWQDGFCREGELNELRDKLELGE